MAKDCLKLWFIVLLASVCGFGLLLPKSAIAQDSVISIEQRLDQLERDNQELRDKVARFENLKVAAATDVDDVETGAPLPTAVPRAQRAVYSSLYQTMEPGVVFTSGSTNPLVTENQVRYIVAEELARQDESQSIPEANGKASADSLQDKKISDLGNALKLFQNNASKKTYPSVAVNGAFQADSGWFHQDTASENQFGQIQDGAGFRRARLSAKGSVTELTNYMFQMDFGAFGRPTFTDLWVEQTKVPFFGNVRIGQWKQPFSLEVASSYRYTTFMERSVLFQPFTPFRHIGIGFYDHSDDLSTTWAASVFRSGQDQFGATLNSDGGYGTAERLTWVPSWESDGKNYLHLGVGHFFNAPPGDAINFRTIPEFFIGANGAGVVGTSGQAVPGGLNGTPFFAATGSLDIPYYNVLGSELLWVDGPVSVQSEVMVNMVNQGTGSTAVLPGAYAQVGYFLTGEHRPYDRKAGAIDRVIPKSNLTFAGNNCSPGMGAWEVAGRWSYLDLNDSAIQGGTLMDYTAGINWYWNPYTKMVFNYVHAIAESPTLPQSQTDMFGVRAQVDF